MDPASNRLPAADPATNHSPEAVGAWIWSPAVARAQIQNHQADPAIGGYWHVDPATNERIRPLEPAAQERIQSPKQAPGARVQERLKGSHKGRSGHDQADPVTRASGARTGELLATSEHIRSLEQAPGSRVQQWQKGGCKGRSSHERADLGTGSARVGGGERWGGCRRRAWWVTRLGRLFLIREIIYASMHLCPASVLF